jgi:pimeloyl-ACP methyl ester carboxylesterase
MIPHLEGDAVAIDLPGRGANPAPLDSLTGQDWAQAVVETITELDSEKVILVGHSLAGITLPRVAEAIPERLSRMVFVSCAVPPDGGSVIDLLTPEIRPLAEQNLKEKQASALPEAVAREMFCGDMTEEQARFVLDRLVPEAWGPMLEPCSLAGLSRGVPTTYVKLLEDTVLPPALQDQMIAHMGEIEVVELEAGHDAMVSQPKRLAALLDRVAAD